MINFRGKLSSNRGNDLLRKILLRRYPNLFADENVQTLLNQYLAREESTRKDIFTQYDVDDTLHAIVAASVEEAGGTFPCKLGKDVPSQTKQQLALYLVSILAIIIVNIWNPTANLGFVALLCQIMISAFLIYRLQNTWSILIQLIVYLSQSGK